MAKCIWQDPDGSCSLRSDEGDVAYCRKPCKFYETKEDDDDGLLR